MEDHGELRKRLLGETRRQVAAAADRDQLIIQTVTTLEQLDHALNRLAKKAREWYALGNPEYERAAKDHETFVREAATKEPRPDSMGGELSAEDKEAIKTLLDALAGLYDEKARLESYLEGLMRANCPNLSGLAGSRIGAQLLSHAGSLRRLATVPSSTVQLYGAETALFRHLRDKRKHRSPKYGLIFNHPLVQKVAQRDRGKAARALADKLSLCAKLDLFKGELKAPEYKRALAAKFTEW